MVSLQHPHVQTDFSSLSNMEACGHLTGQLQCDTVYFSQFSPFTVHDKKSCMDQEVTIPTCEKEKICKIKANPKHLWEALRTIEMLVNPAIRQNKVPIATIKSAIRRGATRLDFTEKALPKLFKMGGGDELAAEIVRNAPKRSAKAATSSGFFSSLGRLLNSGGAVGGVSVGSGPDLSGVGIQPWLDAALEALNDLIVIVPNPSTEVGRPGVGFEIVYRQDWCSLGYRRGRLLRSIPLAAESEVQINIKSWEIRKERREQNQSVEHDISTEIVGDEKWSLATSKQTTTEIGADANAKASVGGTIPIEGVPINIDGGGGGGVNGKITDEIKRAEERIHQTTIKSSDSLKNKRVSIVETNDEIGFETSSTEKIRNPNKCNALTYHYFEITEAFKISTVVDRIQPVVFVRLPAPRYSIDWLLCHECLLRRYLPCETYYAGFEAAKLIKSKRLLGEFDGRIDTATNNRMVDGVLDAIKQLVAVYKDLQSAIYIPESNSPVGAAAGAARECSQELVAGYDRAREKAGNDDWFGAGVEAVRGAVNGVGCAVGKAGEYVDEELSDLADAAQIPGKYIYWKIIEIVAPELANALAILSAANDSIAAMPEGLARTNAAMHAVETFLAQIGDINELFLRIEQGIYIFVGGSTYLAAAGATLLLVPGGAIIAILALALAFAGSAITIGTILAEHADLKAKVMALYGHANQLGDQIDMPIPPATDDPAAWSAYQLELREARARRQNLAEARVELERLLCYLRDNRGYFNKVYWLSLAPEDLQRILARDHKIPAGTTESVIAGFSGQKAAFRVTDLRLFADSGLDIDQIMAEFAADADLFSSRQEQTKELPTRGVTVEPELGKCCACDDFIEEHRKLDIQLKIEEVKQAAAETARLEQRLVAGLLSDPTPFEADGFDETSVVLDMGDGNDT